MRSKPVSHFKHEKLAMYGFLIALIIAVGAFYYIWQSTVEYGRSIAGLESFACAQYQRENPGEPCPDFVLIQPELKVCCCETLSGTGRFGKYAVEAPVPKDADEYTYEQTCMKACSHGGTFLNTGNCKWVERKRTETP